QNWSTNVFNLVTKRAMVYGDATMEWVDGNLGSQITMKYPSVYLMEPGAKGDVLSIAFAGKGQHQDAGGKMIHVAPNTTSTITSKSISKNGGRTSYRGHIKVYPGANNSKSFVKCDALLLDDASRSDTYPYNDVDADNVTLGHEATVSKVSDEQLFYLMSRGITRSEAETMIVNGFIEPFTKELPLEHADGLVQETPKLPKGVVFEPLATAAAKHRQLVEPLLFSSMRAEHDRFSALHAAFFTGGNFLYVPDGVVIEEPILRQHFSHE